MKLKSAEITKYKSIENSSTTVEFEDVTCLVGKNESGKTAFLRALYKINPVNSSDGQYDLLEYPRAELAQYKKIHDSQCAQVGAATYELSDEEVSEIERTFGEGVLLTKLVHRFKNYKNELSFRVEADEKLFVKHLLSSHKPPSTMKELKQAQTCQQVSEALDSLTDKSAVQNLVTALGTIKSASDLRRSIMQTISPRIPKFVYFADYSIMRGTNSIPRLIERQTNNQLDDADRTFIALLSKAGTSLEELLNEQQYEKLKAQLESASNEITDEVFSFWSQNKELEVEFDISDKASSPMDGPPPILHVRIKNRRHRVTVPFDERSRGFIWFFSFLCYFSDLEGSGDQLILLLDEPGLSLHAKAQNDFLTFIEGRLGESHQVVYTTHSPFLVDAEHLERVRTVEDKDGVGTTISGEVLSSDKDTVFPLQAALGYDMAQTLFIGPNCLLVEGPSDLIYLKVLSELCRSKKKCHLDANWVIVPVGGADKISTFVSLLGANKLNIAVLVDVSQKEQQRLKTLQERGFLADNSIIQVIEATGSKNADIEDLFDPKFYIGIVNGAYETELKSEIEVSDLKIHDRIVKAIEEYCKSNTSIGSFDHYRPSAYLLHQQAKLSSNIDSATLDRASILFERANALLKAPALVP